MFHKDDQIIRVNGTFVKDLSLAAVVELLATSVSRMKIEFLTSHTLNKEDDERALSDRLVSWCVEVKYFYCVHTSSCEARRPLRELQS